MRPHPVRSRGLKALKGAEMDKALYEEMYRLEQHHWWFAAKRSIVLSLLEKFLPACQPADTKPRVIDAGCGCGMMLSDLAAHGYDAVGIDASDLAIQFCRARGIQVARGELPGQVDLPPDSSDAVLMLDVLEHVEDDKAAFAAALAIVRPGGIMICTVPAYGWLWTRRDEFHHHKRRYSMGRFREVLSSAADVQPLLVSFMNTFLFPLALGGRLASKLLDSGEKPTDLSIPPAGLNAMLKSIYQSERVLLGYGLTLPFGLSLVAVVRKAGSQP